MTFQGTKDNEKSFLVLSLFAETKIKNSLLKLFVSWSKQSTVYIIEIGKRKENR